MKVLNSYEKRQGGYDVNDVINKLSDIEQASVNIMDSANARKKEIAAQMAALMPRSRLIPPKS